MKLFQWPAASLLLVLCMLSFLTHAAPGGVSSSGFGLWLKSDDAGALATQNTTDIVWEDQSGQGNDLKAIVKNGAAPWSLSPADADHNFHPFTSGFSKDRLFHSESVDFLAEDGEVSPLTMIAVTRMESLPDTDSVARIMGITDNTISETWFKANEPGLSVTGRDNENPGRLQLRLTSGSFSLPDYVYSSPVPVNSSTINYAVIGGSNNTEITLAANSTESFSAVDDPVAIGGNKLSLGYGIYYDSAVAFNGDITEVIWYAEALSDNELQRVNSYLAIKHGISLTSDYLASDSSVVWQSSVNSGYNHHIFGLGRDDASELDQRVSRAVGDASLIVATNNDFESANQSASRSAHSADKSFSLFGHNSLATTFSTDRIGGSYSFRFERIWQTQRLGHNDPVSMKFELPGLAAGSRVYLVRRNSSDDFSQSVTTVGEVDAATGIIQDVQLSDGDFFTLAITLDSDQDGTIDPDDAFPNDPTETDDTDGDGVGDNADTDDDGDGYTDEDENLAGSDPKDGSDVPPDNDNDGISDVLDPDDDNDGLSDSDEALLGTDPTHPDTDNDGVNDGTEVGGNASTPADEDSDGIFDVFSPFNDSDNDGLSNYAEGIIGSDPGSRDSDGDDFRDDEELAVNLTGRDADSDGIDDAMDPQTTGAPDRDNDGIADFALRDTDDNGTPDLLDTDSDADALSDLEETLEDSDGDGIADLTDPVSQSGGGDSDGDFVPDVHECCRDSDLNAVPDYMQSDSDGDFIPDTYEAGLTGADDDGDGYDNYYDADVNGDGIVDNGPDVDNDGLRDTWRLLDTDGDGTPDLADTDSDNDGAPDETETLFGGALNDDADMDGIPSQVDASQGENGGDSDGDTLTDSVECPEGYPYCRDTDNNGTPDYMSVDSDGDGINDADDPDTSTGGGDSDGDGVSDADECPEGQLDGRQCPDSDGDGVPDYLDDDSQYQAPEEAPAVEETVEEQAPAGAEELSDHMTASTGVGAFSWLWVIAGLFMVFLRRRRVLLLATLSVFSALPASAELSSERLYFTGSGEYSRFSPEAEGTVYKVTDRHDWGVSIGAGYDLLDQLALELDFSQKGELQAVRGGVTENSEYSFASVSAAWYPAIWFSNRRYDDTWPHKLNWFISSGVSRMFVSGSADTELENSINLSLGGGVTYGLSSAFELKASAERLSGDVFSWGLGVSWYPFAPSDRGQAGRSLSEEEDIPVYQPYQVASQRVARSHVANCGLELRTAQVEFGEKSYLLKRDYFATLNELSDTFFKCPGITLVIVGTGEEQSDREDDLAFNRARAVFQYLVRRGVPSNRVVISTRPLPDDGSPEHRAEVFFAR